MSFRMQQVIPAGPECVVAAVRFRARSQMSGIQVDQVTGNVVTFRDGRVYRLQAYASLQEGLEAAGVAH